MPSREDIEAEALCLFSAIGMTEDNAKNALKNRKFRDAIVSVVKEAGAEGGTNKSKGALLYEVAIKYPKSALAVRHKVTKDYILAGTIKTKDQLTGGLEYLSALGDAVPVWSEFEASSGIGVEVTPEQIKGAVSEVLVAESSRIQEDRYRSKGVLLGMIRPKIKWAVVEAVKVELQEQLDSILGGVTEEDLKEPEKKKKRKPLKPAAANGKVPTQAAEALANNAPCADETSDLWAHLGKPENNHGVHTTVNFSDGSKMHISNSRERLEEHLRLTGGCVRTRFPPEPNGYLHIGHAKALYVSFGMAERYDGLCFLRFDDTNPEAEKHEYIDHIEDIVSWLGWTPHKVTYSSDYFQELIDLAVQLIKLDKAFVCHQTAEEISRSREMRTPSPWRDRPVAESLRLFNEMRLGLHEEGTATLRMKQDVQNENYNMFDLIAYRIKFVPHPKAGDGWCVYPSYDYTHCIVDALEHITHSLCTLEFESRRASYYWLLKVLDLYLPMVWEYGRLNVLHNVLSKRKLNKLATEGYVDGWDDPRLLTLAGLRRRGVTPGAINNFCRELGITRSDAAIHLHKLDFHVRSDLEASAPRVLAVLQPLLLVFTNLPDDYHEIVNAEVFPNIKANAETYAVHLAKEVWIEATDFREQDAKGYYGLAPNKTIMLRYAGFATCLRYESSGGQVVRVEAKYERPDTRKPPKGVLNWVGRPAPGAQPLEFEARLYDTLFKSGEPAKLGDQWVEDLNSDSRKIVMGALGTPPLSRAAIGDRFQLERLGYFCVDRDSLGGRLVLNRTVTLKESTAKPSR